VKKFELHLDALITIIAVFVLVFSFVLYQRHQFSDLLQENVDLTWDNEILKASLDYKTAQFEDCKNVLKDQVLTKQSDEQPDPVE